MTVSELEAVVSRSLLRHTASACNPTGELDYLKHVPEYKRTTVTDRTLFYFGPGRQTLVTLRAETPSGDMCCKGCTPSHTLQKYEHDEQIACHKPCSHAHLFATLAARKNTARVISASAHSAHIPVNAVLYSSRLMYSLPGIDSPAKP